MLDHPLWIPGAPALSRGKAARGDYERLVRAWALEERFPPGRRLRIVVHTTARVAPSLEAVAALVAEACRGAVAAVELVRDGRDGVEVTVAAEAHRGYQGDLFDRVLGEIAGLREELR